MNVKHIWLFIFVVGLCVSLLVCVFVSFLWCVKVSVINIDVCHIASSLSDARVFELVLAVQCSVWPSNNISSLSSLSSGFIAALKTHNGSR